MTVSAASRCRRRLTTPRSAAIAYLGDERGSGDSLSWNGAVVSDAINPANNFFNSSRSYLGAAVSNAGDLPQLTGDSQQHERHRHGRHRRHQQGLARRHQRDRQRVDRPAISFCARRASSPRSRPTRPDLSTSTKTVANLTSHPGGAVLRGDTLEYTITVINSGFDTATGGRAQRRAASGLTFVPGLDPRSRTGANAGRQDRRDGRRPGRIHRRVAHGARAAGDGRERRRRRDAGPERLDDGRVPRDASTRATLGHGQQPGDRHRQRARSARAAQDYLSDGNAGDGRARRRPTCSSSSARRRSDCSGATPLCLTSVSPRLCVRLPVERQLRRARRRSATRRRTACRACAADAAVPGDRARLPGVGRLRRLLGDEHRAVRRVDADLRHVASRPACSAWRTTTAAGATPVCNTATQGLRRLPGQRRLRRVDADLRSGVPDLPGLRRRQRVRRRRRRPASRAARAASARRATRCACTGATPVCEVGSGTCVRCVANADCSGTTPVCDGGTHTCRACGGDGECGGATPACQAERRVRPVLGDATPARAAARRRSASRPAATCVPCVSNAQCGGTTPVCNTATHACRACASDGECGGRDAGLSGERRLRAVLGDATPARAAGATPVCFAAERRPACRA